MKKIIIMTATLFISIAAFSQNSKAYSNHSDTKQGEYNNGQPGGQHTVDAGRAGELNGSGNGTHVNNEYHSSRPDMTTRTTRHYHTTGYTRYHTTKYHTSRYSHTHRRTNGMGK
jgi:hypothetical protein